MKVILTFFGIVLVFSLLTVYELILLRRAGFDIIAHLKVTHDQGPGYKLFFEAFGVIAFVLVQPLALTALVVWAANNVSPQILQSLLNFIQW